MGQPACLEPLANLRVAGGLVAEHHLSAFGQPWQARGGVDGRAEIIETVVERHGGALSVLDCGYIVCGLSSQNVTISYDHIGYC